MDYRVSQTGNDGAATLRTFQKFLAVETILITHPGRVTPAIHRTILSFLELPVVFAGGQAQQSSSVPLEGSFEILILFLSLLELELNRI